MRLLEGELIHELVKDTPSDLQLLPSMLLPRDRWLLGSALQKTIRRGLCIDATDAALTLYSIDAEYAWRRLRVIAIEDVGIGDIETVATVLAVAGKRALRRTFGDQRLLVLLVNALCVAPKDRTACDLLCWIELSPAVARFRSELLCTPDRWEALAKDDCAPMWRRAVAMQLVAGFTIKTREGYQVVTRGDSAVWRRIVEALKPHPMVAFASLRGSNTESLNIALPFAQLYRDAANRAPLIRCEGETQNPLRIGRFIAPAFCMHTRVGLRALRLFLSRETEFHAELIRAGATDKIKALGFLLFQIESGLLDRFEDYAPEVRTEAERAELAHYGIFEDADAVVLRMMLKQRMPALDAARRRAWDAYEGEIADGVLSL